MGRTEKEGGTGAGEEGGILVQRANHQRRRVIAVPGRALPRTVRRHAAFFMERVRGLIYLHARHRIDCRLALASARKLNRLMETTTCEGTGGRPGDLDGRIHLAAGGTHRPPHPSRFTSALTV